MSKLNSLRDPRPNLLVILKLTNQPPSRVNAHLHLRYLISSHLLRMTDHGVVVLACIMYSLLQT